MLERVIKVYRITVPDDEPLKHAYAMQSTEIERTGTFVDVSVDHAEVQE